MDENIGQPQVQRLNRLIPVVIITVMALVLLALFYAVHLRSQKQNLNQSEITPDVSSTLITEGQDAAPTQSAASQLKDIISRRPAGNVIQPSFENQLSESEPSSSENRTTVTAPVTQQPTLTPEQIDALAPIDDRSVAIKEYHEALYRDALDSDTQVKFDPIYDERSTNKASGISNSFNGDFDPKITGEELAQRGSVASGIIPSGAFTAAQNNGANQQRSKQAFINQRRSVGYNRSKRQKALSEYELKAGTLIPATLLTAINTDLPGQALAQVSRDVRDSRTGDVVLIPAGSRLIGEYDSKIPFGQKRVPSVWYRVQFPDGSTLEIGNMVGVDALGRTGLKARVNTKPSRGSDVQPTLKLPPGYTFNVFLTRDFVLEEWVAWGP